MMLANRFKYVFLFIMSIGFAIDAQRKVYSSPIITDSEIQFIKKAIVPLGGLDDLKPITQLIDNTPYVLIGDSTHGSYEFYQQRINITKRLIQNKNFKLIVLEGDFPNIYLINQYIHSLTAMTAMQVLNVSNSQGAWFWGNVAMLNFIQWLKKYNEQLPEEEQKVSLYGIDIYSFERSKAAVINYLSWFSPEAALQAKRRYQCFNRYNNLHHYAKAVRKNELNSCEVAVMEQYLDFSSCRFPCPEEYVFLDRDAFFYAEQNARIIKNTERSFRLQYQTGNDSESWNQRDRHMMESLLAISDHLHQPKAIIWAHNSHVGDARATEMRDKKQLNIGQLMRQYFKQSIFSIGMLTYRGLVMAADDWDSISEVKVLLNAHPFSNEAVFHLLDVPHFLLDLHQTDELEQILNMTRLQRHVGVVYRPDDEMDSHYTYTHLADQFDAVIFIDNTTPVIMLNSRI